MERSEQNAIALHLAIGRVRQLHCGHKKANRGRDTGSQKGVVESEARLGRTVGQLEDAAGDADRAETGTKQKNATYWIHGSLALQTLSFTISHYR